jgi:hypothetical protein
MLIHLEKSCYVVNEFIAPSLLVGICQNFDIYYSGYIQTHYQKNKKIKRTEQILPEVYGTTLSSHIWSKRSTDFKELSPLTQSEQFFKYTVHVSYREEVYNDDPLCIRLACWFL